MNKTTDNFVLYDQNGNKFDLYSELDKPVMLVFYPKDDSPVCTKQMCDYRDNYQKFLDTGFKVIGISIDSKESHKDFSEKYNLPFPLLSDVKKEVSRQFNALNFMGLNKRKIVIISPQKEIIFEDTVLPIKFRKTEELLNLAIPKNKS